MKCLSFIKNHTGTFMLFCSLFVSFFVSLLSVSNSYAIEDWSVTLDSSNSYTVNICHNSNPSSSQSGHACSDYKYLIFYSETDFSSVPSAGFYFTFDSYNRIQSNSIHPYVIFSTPTYNIGLGIFTGNNSSAPSGWSVTIILSESLPGASITPSTINITENGTYNVTDYTEAVVNVENEIIYGDYHNDLINITNGIYVCAGTILVIYFFYCIYRLIIKNSGVK